MANQLHPGCACASRACSIPKPRRDLRATGDGRRSSEISPYRRRIPRRPQFTSQTYRRVYAYKVGRAQASGVVTPAPRAKTPLTLLFAVSAVVSLFGGAPPVLASSLQGCRSILIAIAHAMLGMPIGGISVLILMTNVLTFFLVVALVVVLLWTNRRIR